MTTVTARVASLEQREAERFAASLSRLSNDELDARVTAFGATPIRRYLYERITGEYLRRLRLMSEEDLATWDAAHFTPEESARIDAQVEAELAAEGWVRPDEL
jgi:hypothetical protein